MSAESFLVFSWDGRTVEVSPKAIDYYNSLKTIETGVRAAVEAGLKVYAEKSHQSPAEVSSALSECLAHGFNSVLDWIPKSPELATRLSRHVDEAASNVFLTTIVGNLVSSDMDAATSALARADISLDEANRVKSDFLAKVIAKVRSAVVTYLVQTLHTSLSTDIGPVFEGLDFRGLQQKLERDFAVGYQLGKDEVVGLLALLPSNQKLVRRAFEVAGDQDGSIARVVETFGLACKPIKLALIKEDFGGLKIADEESALAAVAKGTRLVERMGLADDADALAFLRPFRKSADDFDLRFRMVGSVVYPTRLEAELTRRDIDRLRDYFGEDPTPLLAYARYDAETVPPARLDVGADLTGRLSDWLADFSPRDDDSPFLRFVRRAFQHVRDFGRYAGNARIETWREAEPVRKEKGAEFAKRVADSKQPQVDFALDGAMFQKGGIQRLFRWIRGASQEAVAKIVARYYGESLPDDVHTFAGILRWQAGFDVIDPVAESCQEISPEGLPAGFVSTHELLNPDEFDSRLTAVPSEGDVVWCGVFKLRPKDRTIPLPSPPPSNPQPVAVSVDPVSSSSVLASEMPGTEVPTPPTCPSCGTVLVVGARFCRKCGMRVGE